MSETDIITGRSVSKFSRLIIVWAGFIPLSLLHVKGETLISKFPGALGLAFGIATISWLLTVKMRPTTVSLFSTFCVGLVVYLISGIGRQIEPIDKYGIPASVRRSLENTARQINSQAPMRVDKYTLLMSAGIAGRTMMYRNAIELELSDGDLQELLRDARISTIDNYKRNPADARVFAKYKVLVIYQYMEKGGKVVNLELDFQTDSDLAWARK